MQHFSCAGINELSELRAGRQDDPRTKRVVAEWRRYFYTEMKCKPVR